MKIVTSLFIVILIFNNSILSQSIIGGDLSFRKLTAYNYEFYLTVISVDTIAGGTRPNVVINYGDGISDTVPRASLALLPGFIKRETYISTHTFPSSGIYNINIIGGNWISNINNINNSINEPFQITQTLNINSFVGNNNSVELSGVLYDTAKVGQLYIYNPFAYDSDGDSLSYSIVPCLTSNYVYPIASSSFSIDSISGDLVWNKPVEIGYYAVAIKIDEWRNTFKIGSTIRQMIIKVNFPLSIDINENTENSISIFPNPASDFLYINTIENEADYEIYNQLGKKVLEGKYNTNGINIKLLSQGLYLIRISNNRQTVSTNFIKL